MILGTVYLRQEKVEEYSAPVLIACPEPAFKPSFFKENKLTLLSIEKIFWSVEQQRNRFENYTSMLPVYMNMSYELGLDWEIAMFEFRYSKNNLGKNCLAFFTYCNIIYWEPKKVSELEYISGKFK